MTLSYQNGINVAGNPPYTDACPNPANNTFATVEGSTPRMRVFNLSNLIMLTSAQLSFSNPTGITMVSGNSAVVVFSNSTTVDFLDTTTGAKTNVAGGLQSGAYRTVGGQFVAGDLTTGIAYAISSTVGHLVKMNASGSTLAVSDMSIIQNEQSQPNYTCVILKSPGRWLVGSNYGKIIEIDSTPVVIDDFVITLREFPGQRKGVVGGAVSFTIQQMSYDNNILTVVTDMGFFVIDWSTKTIIKTQPAAAVNTTTPIILSYPASGVNLCAPRSNATGISVFELDTTIQPLTVRDNLYIPDVFSSSPVGAGINPTNGNGYIIYQNGRIRTLNVTPRGSVLHTVTILTTGNGHLSGRLLLIDDTNGVGNSKVVLDTYMNSPATYRVPASGTTLIEAVRVNHGVMTLWDLTRYST